MTDMEALAARGRITVGELLDELVRRGFIVPPVTDDDRVQTVLLLAWIADGPEPAPQRRPNR